LAWSALLTAVVFVAVAVAVNRLGRMSDRYHETNLALSEGRHLYEDRAYSQAIQVLSHGLEIGRDLPGGDDLRRALTSQLEQAQRAQTRFELHALVERLRFQTEGVAGVSLDDLGKLAAHCAELWAARDWLLSDAALDAMSANDATQVRNDLLELVLFWLDARERAAKGEGLTPLRKDALHVLAEVEALLGTNRVLERQRQVCADALGMEREAHAAGVRADQLPPQTSWEHYLEGRWLLRARHIESAHAAFAEAATLQPQDFWPHFYQGVCEYRLKRTEAAAVAFGVCIALLPDRAECYYNRGLALARLGRAEDACRDFDRALQLAPNLAAASLERAVLHYQARRYPSALDDLNNALAHGADAATVHYNEALVHQARQDFRSARASLEQALRANPSHSAARALSVKLQDVP
jgi:tetratricopeptide (TPR) repeat protein